MKKTVFLIALLIFGIFSSQEWKEVTIGSPFKISYPTNYVKTYDLNADASLQIMNAIKEKYTIIIQDDREALKDLKHEVFELRQKAYIDIVKIPKKYPSFIVYLEFESLISINDKERHYAFSTGKN